MKILVYSLIFLPMAEAVVSYIIGRSGLRRVSGKRARDIFVSGAAVLEFALALSLLTLFLAGNQSGAAVQSGEAARFAASDVFLVRLPGICGMGLSFTADGFRAVYAGVAAFMWMCASLFSIEYFAHYKNRNRYYMFWLVTLGATEGIFLSADLYTTFVFFEVMSFASYVWVAQDERQESLRAAETYLAVALIGGLVMLMGLFLLYAQVGTLEIDKLYEACRGKNVYPAALCLLVGFGAKAGAFPLHIWLPKAHPAAPAPASAMLSGILTKTGIFGVLVISCKMLPYDAIWGTLILALGTVTMLLGAALALFSVDLKRTLACSSISQIGFIFVGIGMQGLLGKENILAVRGSFLHMVNHSLFKLVLFLAAGVIYMNLHKLNLNDVRGFGRKKPLLGFIFLMGALGIGGLPLFSGYISKTLLHESIVEYTEKIAAQPSLAVFFSAGSMRLIEWIFLISGGFTVAYMAKLFTAVFVEENRDKNLQAAYDARKDYMNPLSAAVLTVCALLFPIMGIFSGRTLERLADFGQGFMGVSEAGEKIRYFSFANLRGALISILIGVLLYLIGRYWLMEKQEDGGSIYVDRLPKSLDLEEALYRPLLLKVFPAVFGCLCGLLDALPDHIAAFLPKAGAAAAGFFDTLIDSLVVLLRKTIYRDSPRAEEIREGNELTHFLGKLANGVRDFLNGTFLRKRPLQKNYEHKLAIGYSDFKENSAIISRSLSYGLILFCLGLCATLLYLLVSSVG